MLYPVMAEAESASHPRTSHREVIEGTSNQIIIQLLFTSTYDNKT